MASSRPQAACYRLQCTYQCAYAYLILRRAVQACRHAVLCGLAAGLHIDDRRHRRFTACRAPSERHALCREIGLHFCIIKLSACTRSHFGAVLEIVPQTRIPACFFTIRCGSRGCVKAAYGVLDQYMYLERRFVNMMYLLRIKMAGWHWWPAVTTRLCGSLR